VSQAKPLKMQSELMVEEMMNAEEYEYAPKGLPMLLHQVNIRSLLSFTMSILPNEGRIYHGGYRMVVGFSTTMYLCNLCLSTLKLGI
jgi:hypothetical protein